MEAEQFESSPNPCTLYLYAMKSPVTRDKYQKRLGKFFDFLRLEGSTTEEQKVGAFEIARKEFAYSDILRIPDLIILLIIMKTIINNKISTY